ncbi:hypothetical protein ACFO5Q_14555 [Kordiimonas lipolytica]|uniref:Spore coat protein U domain-containing protein n=1 Tax=Kordiimonas lipolytica TaxID=1662421 RepID=A0ABV8UCW6_9PROT|nr:hypothetical protein [Kordiimonas lipolytica]
MTLADLLTRHWHRSATRSAAILAIWSQILLASQQAAADSPQENNLHKNTKRPTARIGVSAVVLPRCIVRMARVQVAGSAEPLEILCTRETDYQLAVQRPGQQSVSIKTAAYQSTNINKAGNLYGQASYYQLPRGNSAKKRETGASGEITILALDF